MKREDDQELWDLLGHIVPAPELSPFFARNVVRQIRQEKGWRDYVFGWMHPQKLIPASAVALALLVLSFSIRVLPRESPDSPPPVVASIDPQDYDVVADLDDLLATDDDLWNDNDSSQL